MFSNGKETSLSLINSSESTNILNKTKKQHLVEVSDNKLINKNDVMNLMKSCICKTHQNCHLSFFKLSGEYMQHSYQNKNKNSSINEQKETFSFLDSDDDDYDVSDLKLFDKNKKEENDIFDKVNKINVETFHHDKFRGFQIDAIMSALEGNDVLIIMPTGGGKSLCYQIPAIIQDGLTIVISPLISLIEDQVQQLKQLNLRVEHLNKQTDHSKYHIINNDAMNGKLHLLYLTPERLIKSSYMKNTLDALYKANKIVRFVIDEAHCIVQWGKDFREDYLKLNILKEKYPKVPIMALTATATKTMKSEIIDILNIKNCDVFIQSFNRQNLFFEVKEIDSPNKLKFIMKWIDKHFYRDSIGIIFCSTIQDTERISSFLNRNNFKSKPYNSKIKPEEKTLIQQQWMNEQITIIVATSAFGMGINKPNVRFVVHYSVSRSIEEYYQESGRAGRDEKLSHCLLLFDAKDYFSLKKCILSKSNFEQKTIEIQHLDEVVKYSIGKLECRKKKILKYFDESDIPNDCNRMCDYCMIKDEKMHQINKIDMTQHASNIINIINQKKEAAPFLTTNYLISFYTGSKDKKIMNSNDCSFEEWGKGSAFKKDKQFLLFRLLCFLSQRKIIEEKEKYLPHGPVYYWVKGSECDNFLISKQAITFDIFEEVPFDISSPEISPIKKKKTGIPLIGNRHLTLVLEQPIKKKV